MAFEVKKIDPLDLQPRKAIGVDLPFSSKSVFNQTYQTKDAIKANLVNYFLTNKGERYLNPTFGSDIRKVIFEQITEEQLDTIEAIVGSDVDRYFPRVKPTRISVNSQPDSNSVTLFMSYTIADTYINDEIIINFEQ